LFGGEYGKGKTERNGKGHGRGKEIGGIGSWRGEEKRKRKTGRKRMGGDLCTAIFIL